MVAEDAGGVGPTEDLTLRVSVATVSRVVFPNPHDGTTRLALEQKTHIYWDDGQQQVFAQAQPFGGGARLLAPATWRQQLGDFQFDSHRSQAEQDFRIFISPVQWPRLKQLVSQELRRGVNDLIDSDPFRELAEEFQETLGVELRLEQYSSQRTAIAIEEEPTPTHSRRAPGRPTARVYAIDEVNLKDEELGRRMLDLGRQHSSEYLLQLAQDRAAGGMPGRAIGLFVAPLDEIRRAYQSIEPPARDEPLPFGGTILSGNVVVLLPGIKSPKYNLIAM